MSHFDTSTLRHFDALVVLPPPSNNTCADLLSTENDDVYGLYRSLAPTQD
jgi:hypothetical protein